MGHYPFTVAPSSRRGQALLVSFLRANNISGAAAAAVAAATGREAVAASCELMLRLAHCAVSLSRIQLGVHLLDCALSRSLA